MQGTDFRLEDKLLEHHRGLNALNTFNAYPVPQGRCTKIRALSGDGLCRELILI